MGRKEMDKINYDLKMKDMIEHLDKKPKLLLHACCAPCSSYVLEYISKYFEITILYYNPNIYPKEEYQRRRDEVSKFLKEVGYSISVIELDYNEEEYENAVRDTFMLGERSKRCYNCYKLRLERTARYAYENHFDFFTTTLSISPYKNSEWINEIGKSLEEKYFVSYLYSDFKKNNGYKRSLELSKIYHLYRQDYCGCKYSKKEREEYVIQKATI